MAGQGRGRWRRRWKSEARRELASMESVFLGGMEFMECGMLN
jgi:hypothetical protein